MNVQHLRALAPWWFLVLALLASLLFAFTTPPFQVADEQTHLQRADAITFGVDALQPLRDPAGAPRMMVRVHQAVLDASVPFEHLKFHPEEKLRAEDMAAAQGRFDLRIAAVYPGQAVNPLLYLPSAVALAVGEHFGWTVLDTLYLGRALDAVASIVLGVLALSLAGQARLPFFALLCLPMTLALFGAVSQDGPLMGTAAVTAALFSRAMSQGRPMRAWEWTAAAVGLAMLGMAKPPYALLTLLLFVAPAESRAGARLAGVVALLTAAAWNGWTSASGWAAPPPPAQAADPSAQLASLAHNPGLVLQLAASTVGPHAEHLPREFIGMLGWLDTRLPLWFYPAAYVMLGVALAAAVARDGQGDWRPVRVLAPLLALAAAAGVFAALYLAWTSVGLDHVQGVQGRYFLPLAFMLALAVEGRRPLLAGRLGDAAGAAVTLAILLFPVLGLLVTEISIVQRFYAP